jgi:hypothetical protein
LQVARQGPRIHLLEVREIGLAKPLLDGPGPHEDLRCPPEMYPVFDHSEPFHPFDIFFL